MSSQSRHNGHKFFDELPKSVQQIIENVTILDGEMCPCCGRRKPTRKITSHLDAPGSWIPRDKVVFIFEEIIARIGFAEATRQIPYNRSSLRRLVNADKPYVRLSTVEKAMKLLAHLRENNIVYGRNTIIYGRVARGLEPQPPTGARDYNKPHGDLDADYKRQQRKREEELENLAGY